MLDTNSDRFRLISGNDVFSSPSEKLLISEKVSNGSSISFSEDPVRSFPLYRGKISKILDVLNSCMQETTEAFQEASEIIPNLIHSRGLFFKSVEREVDRIIHEKKYDVERYKENLVYIMNELKNHEKVLNEVIENSEGATDNFVMVMKERVEKTMRMLRDEKPQNAFFDLGLEVVSKKFLKEMKEKTQDLANEVERLNLRKHEMTPDTARLRPLQSPDTGDNIEEIDALVCQRVSEIIMFLQEFTSLKVEKNCYKAGLINFSPGNDRSFHLKCFDHLRLLEQKIVNTLQSQSEKLKKIQPEKEKNTTSIRKLSQSDLPRTDDLFRLKKELENMNLSNLALNRVNHEQAQSLQEIKEKLSQSVQEVYVLKQKYSASKNHESELSKALRNQELANEKKSVSLQDKAEERYLTSKVEELEEELRLARHVIETGSTSNFERELENVRKIYNDKYEELFRLTSVQIGELEQKLLESNSVSQNISESTKNAVRKEELKIKQEEFQRLNQMHNRELRLIQCEFEDFLMKTRSEIGKLGKLVEKAIESADIKLLSSLQDDIQKFSKNVQSKSEKVKEESFSLSVDDERTCKRCGLNDNKSRFCAFHPYLVNADAQELLYSAEWHKCREAKHSPSNPPCVKTGKHCYSSESPSNFIKIFDSFHGHNMTFANSNSFHKENLDTPSKTLEDALFSSLHKEKNQNSATELLDNYLKKYD